MRPHHGPPLFGRPGFGCTESGVHPHINDNSPLSTQVFESFWRASHASKHLMARRFAAEGTHPGQALMLALIASHDGVSQRDLAEILGIARPTVTIMLKRMEKAGLVERRADENDKRFTRIYLTSEGDALRARVKDIHEKVVEATIEPLTEEDQRELKRLLDTITSNVSAAFNNDTTHESGEDL